MPHPYTYTPRRGIAEKREIINNVYRKEKIGNEI
jgi:hypothetical protein